MRRCPNCNRIFPSSDDYRFCRVDGAVLLSDIEATEASTLQVLPADTPTLKIPDGIVRTENAAALEVAEQVQKERELEQLRKDLRRKEDAVKYAHDEVDLLLERVQRQVKELNESFSKISIEYLVTDVRQVAIISEGYGVKIAWQQRHVNNLNESRFVVVEYRRGRTADGEREFTKSVFDFDINSEFQPGWKDRRRFVSTEELSRECVGRLMTLLRDKPEAEEIGKEPILLSENEVRQPESVTRKTKEGLVGLLRFNMPVCDKSESLEVGDEVHLRGRDYIVFEKKERRYPEVSEGLDEFWVIAK